MFTLLLLLLLFNIIIIIDNQSAHLLDGRNELKQILWGKSCWNFEHADHSTAWRVSLCTHHL